MNKTNLFIDTDMGNDDIMAIAMLLQSPTIKITGISLSYGVSDVNKGAPNLKSLLSFLDTDIPLYKDFSIKSYPYQLKFPSSDINRAEELTLLQKLDLKPQREPLITDIYELLEQLPDETTILALGPLTNIAKIYKSNQKLFNKKIKKIVLMGGGIKKGNVPPDRLAEYNIALDPSAAETVFNSGVKVVMIGIDATAWVPATSEFQRVISQIQTSDKIPAILKSIIINNQSDFDQFYDPLAAAWFFDEEIFSNFIKGEVTVPVSGKQKGATILTETKNAKVIVPLQADSGLFYNLLKSLITGKH